MRWARCQNCFKTHFPYPKLCHWERSKQKIKLKVNECISLSNELKLKINNQITRLEAKETPLEDLICEAVFLNGNNSPSFPDEGRAISPEQVSENRKFKLKGGAKAQGKGEFKIKQFISKIAEYNIALNCLRSSKAFDQFNSHAKCPVKNHCSFCLLRSLIFRSNSSKGRIQIVPVEVEFEHGWKSFQRLKSTTLAEILNKVFTSYPLIKKTFSPSWICTGCKSPPLPEEEAFIHLNEDTNNRKIAHLLKLKLESQSQQHAHYPGNCDDVRRGTKMILGDEQKTCIFRSSSIEIDLQESLEFGSKFWKCVGAICESGESYFKLNHKWFNSS